MEEKQYLDLLIVDVNDKPYVVKAPSNKASHGDLVEFELKPGVTLMGSVEDHVWCQEDDDTFRCFGYMTPIYPAKKVYREVWADDEDDHIQRLKFPAEGGRT